MYLVYSDYDGGQEFSDTEERAIELAKSMIKNQSYNQDAEDIEVEIYKLYKIVSTKPILNFDIKDANPDREMEVKL